MGSMFHKKVGEKLKKVRKKLGLTLKEVQPKMGFDSYQILSNIESGERKIRADELAKFAKIYLQDINYFLDESPITAKPHCVWWRDYNKQDEKTVRLREGEFLKYCRNYYDLERMLNYSHECTLPLDNTALLEFNDDKIKGIADKYSKLMQLGSRPAYSLKGVLEDKFNVKILYLDLAGAGAGAAAVGEFGASILLNCSNTTWRRSFDLAHELFHIITNEILRSNNSKRHESIEKWANMFASEILLPDNEVLIEFNRMKEFGKITLIDMIGLAREFKVSTEAMLWKLADLGKISRKIVKDLKKNKVFKNIDGDLRKGDNDYPSLLSPRYVKLALKLYQRGLMTRGRFAEFLGVDRNRIPRILTEFGYVEEDFGDVEFTVT